MQPAAGFSNAFFGAMQNTGLGITGIEAFRASPSGLSGARDLSFVPASLAGGLPDRIGAICSFGPLPAAAIANLRDRYPSARLIASLDSPRDFRAFEPTVEASDAVIVAHRSFEGFIPSPSRRGAAHNRLLAMSERGLLFCIMPGIDLEKYNPASDDALQPHGGSFCAQYPRSQDGTIGPSGKQENYQTLQHILQLEGSKDIENMAVADPGAANADIFKNAFAGYQGGTSVIFFGDGDPSAEIEGLIEYANRRRGSRRSTYIRTSDDRGLRILLAGSGYAVFFDGIPSPEYPSTAAIRSVLLFMRYGTMPIVPKIYEDWGIVERCVLPRGTERSTWLTPKGFAFIHDGSARSISNAIGSASMHDFRTRIGHGIFSQAVPNAMQAAATHDIRAEGKAYAAALRTVIAGSETPVYAASVGGRQRARR